MMIQIVQEKILNVKLMVLPLVKLNHVLILLLQLVVEHFLLQVIVLLNYQHVL